MNIKAFWVKTIIPVLAVVQGFLVVPPIALTYWIYHLAQRAAVLIGRWPVPMINDPKWIGQNDGAYQHLYDTVERVDGITFCSFFAWMIVMALAFRWYSRRARLLQFGLFIFAWGLLWFNPWSLLSWWED